MDKISIDFTAPTGPVKQLNGVNNCPMRLKGGKRQGQPELHDIGVPYCRLHDTAGAWGGTHYVDIPNVFPDFDADENDPASYDFAFTDALLAELVLLRALRNAHRRVVHAVQRLDRAGIPCEVDSYCVVHGIS